MSEIETITFSRDIPEKYDECWNANAANTGHIKGYLIGNDVIIVGKYIYANKISHNMFAAHNGPGSSLWSNLNKINGLDLINTSLVKDMSTMFAFTKLTEINGIGKWDVSNVKTFAGMFQGDSNQGNIKLKYLDVGQWNTSSATNMSHVFYGCALMEYIPIENWDVSKVTTFSHMFADCYGLKSIDFSKWNTSSVVSFDCLLNDCRSLTVVDVSSLNTRTCTQFSQMFEACINLESIVGLDKWDVSNASDHAFSETFHCCYKLKEVDIGSWVTTPDNTARMFKNCYSLKEIDLSGFDMTNIKYDEEMFMNCNAVIKKNDNTM
jgi:surface protein